MCVCARAYSITHKYNHILYCVKTSACTTSIINFWVRIRVRFKIRIRSRVRVGMVFRIMVRFPLSIQWRGAGVNRKDFRTFQHH